MNIHYFSNSIGATWGTKNSDIPVGFEIAGSKHEAPKEGDYLIGEIQKCILVYKLSNIRKQDNPKDMFFAYAKHINGFDMEDMKTISKEKCDDNKELFETIKNYKYGTAGFNFA